MRMLAVGIVSPLTAHSEFTESPRHSGHRRTNLFFLDSGGQQKWPAGGRALPAEYWLYGSNTNFGDFGRLRPFRTLNNLKLHLISFLKRAVPIAGDGGIMNENVWAIIAPDEAIPFGIIEPLDSSLQRLPPE